MTRLSAEIANRLSPKGGTRYGTVVSLGDGVVGVLVRGEEIEAPYVHNLYPTRSVGDRVAMVSSGSGYLVVGRVDLPLPEWNEPEELTLDPLQGWVRSMWLQLNGVWRDPSGPEEWITQFEMLGFLIGQVDYLRLLPELGINASQDNSSCWTYPPVGDRIPAGGEVLGAKVALTSAPAEFTTYVNGVPTPTSLYGPPPLVQMGLMTLSGSMPASSTTPWPASPGYAIQDMSVLPRETTGYFHLPDAWVDALVDGTANGLGIRTPSGQVWLMSDTAPLTITYRTPYVPDEEETI